MNKLRKIAASALVVLLLTASLPATGWAFDRFTNYGVVTDVNDIRQSGSFLWMATSGGLYKVLPGTGIDTLFTRLTDFPDLECTALETDGTGGLWVGTARGYLYHRDAQARQSVYSAYVTSGWNIGRMLSVQGYLVITSRKGCSVFSPEKGVVLKNATSFGSSLQPPVRTLAVFGDSLFLGFDQGVASIDVSNGKLAGYNFNDPSIWQTRTTGTAVISFVVSGSSIETSPYISARRSDGAVISARRDTLYKDEAAAVALSAPATCILPRDDGSCWIGTQGRYFFLWDGAATLDEFPIEGLTFSGIDRVFLNRAGVLWVLPYISTPLPWNKRITTFSNGTWRRFDDVVSIGVSQPYFHAITQDETDRMWIGTYGSPLYRYDPVTDSITLFWAGSAMCTAVAMDSSRFIWFGVNYGEEGCIMSMSPANREALDPTQMRYFFGPASPYNITNISAMSVATDGRIFCGGMDGKVICFTHNGNPDAGETSVTDAVNVGSFGYVNALAAAPDGNTWIVGSTGLFRYNNSAKRIESVKNFPDPVSAVAVEDSGVIWAGGGEKLTRIKLENKADNNSGISLSCSLQTFYAGIDFPFSPITDLCIDKVQGSLWIATVQGLSQMYLGDRSLPPHPTELQVYPNPFSQAKGGAVVFKRVKSGARVSIYSLTGNRVANAKPIITGTNEWTYEWVPGKDIVPGGYFCAIGSGSDRLVRKLFIVP